MNSTWVCIRGASLPSALDVLGLSQQDEANDGMVFEHSLVGGVTHRNWCFIFANWSLLPLERVNFLDGPLMFSKLSRLGELVCCSRVDATMDSGVESWNEGRKIWWATHQGGADTFHLDIEGRPPRLLECIAAAATKRQEREIENDPEVDYLIEVPSLIMRRMTGFRTDIDLPSPSFVSYQLDFRGRWRGQRLSHGDRASSLWWKFW